jgi:hypothetical protein
MPYCGACACIPGTARINEIGVWFTSGELNGMPDIIQLPDPKEPVDYGSIFAFSLSPGYEGNRRIEDDCKVFVLILRINKDTIYRDEENQKHAKAEFEKGIVSEYPHYIAE